MSTRTPIVRAIDIGYGACKFTRGHQHTGAYLTDKFTSIVKQTNSAAFKESHRNNCFVTINNNVYEAGKDMDAAFDSKGGRALHENFIHTDEYNVLLKASLHYIDEEQIDLLVVGLPASFHATKKDALKKLIKGQHLVQDRTINIKDILIVSQPVGGFMSIVKANNLSPKIVNEQRNLLVDPGFYTVDFIAAKGLKPISDLYGSSPFGMHALLSKMCELISKDFKIQYDNISSVDEGLQKGSFTLFGKPVDLNKYVKKSMPVFKPAIKEIENKIGDGREIQKIIIVGGGAQYFESILKKAFPMHEVIVSDTSQMSNVIGFQFMGELKLGIAQPVMKETSHAA